LSFTLHSDRIIIDSNEDGFKENHVQAICSTGQSTKTKTNADGYIGEKGIGFKSVFKVADKVHVQSEPYSFVFHYKRDDPNDNGIGMVTPFNEPHCKLPDGVKTRMTLYLLEDEDEDKESLQAQLLGLQDTLLMFLKNLRKLSIRIIQPDKVPLERVYSVSTKAHRISIHRTIGNAATTQYFWTTKRRVTHMPKDRMRKDRDETEIVLAFPLDSQDIPIIADQQAFAFLPLRTVGYKVCSLLLRDEQDQTNSSISFSSRPTSSPRLVVKTYSTTLTGTRG
jgi:hypothetical protein